MGKLKNSISKHFVELLVVAFGVILGMFVSDWNDGRHVKNNVNKTMLHLRAELNLNIDRLEKAITYHDTLCQNIDHALGELEEEEFLTPYYKSEFRHHKIKGWRGPGIAGLEDIVFESAKISGIFQELDISTTQLLSRAYKIQDSYRDFSKSPVEKFLALHSESKTLDVVGILELICNDLKGEEIWAKRNLEEILEKLDEK